MTVKDEIVALERRLEALATQTDEELTARYELKRPPMPPGWYWRLRWLVGKTLRWLESMRLRRPDSWPVSLKQSGTAAKAKPLLIWAVGTDRDALREACDRLSGLRNAFPSYAPVLVTDVTDFAFFSRLGWLVEYLPKLSGEGDAYEERKLKYLARLYRHAPVLTVEVGLKEGMHPDVIRKWLASRG